MNLQDLYAISPQICMIVLGMLLILFDLFFAQKVLLRPLVFIGLLGIFLLNVFLWVNIDSNKSIDAFSNSLVLDEFGLFFNCFFIGVVFFIIFISQDYIKSSKAKSEYYSLIIFSATGMMLLTSSMELISFYIALELTTLPIVALVAFNRDIKSSEAGVKFLILSGISSALLLYGMVILFGFTGSTLFNDIANIISQSSISNDKALLFSSILLISGFGFKISAAPFHMWAPDVYDGAPMPITSYLAIASKVAGIAILLRIIYSIFHVNINLIGSWSEILIVLSILSMFLGNLIAIRQTNIKRLIAYSSISHTGFILIGVISLLVIVSESGVSNSLDAASSVIFYILGYSLTNLALFTTVTIITNNINSSLIDDFSGISKISPVLAFTLSLVMISLIGLPPTVGFFSKAYIFNAAIKADLIWLVLLGLINTAISAYYYLRIVKILYLEEPSDNLSINFNYNQKLFVISTLVLIFIFGIFPRPLIDLSYIVVNILV
ncbi:MAG: NADH-quinone oxidoreductase subunit N [SAR202 cluster bacterium]|nr:NADH-quinone oxidoreductase subunit N [SAR202 cluster bacterium]